MQLSQTDKGTVSGAENKFMSGRERKREREREKQVGVCACLQASVYSTWPRSFRDKLHLSTSPAATSIKSL